MNNRKLVIVAPVFHTGGTGAAVYYRLLGADLAGLGWTVSVISDRERGDFEGSYYPLFPSRSARTTRPVRDRLAFLVENLRYCAIPTILRQEQPCAVLIHESFHRFPGLFSVVRAWAARTLPSVRFVADVRSPQLACWGVRQLRRYERVISCAESVSARLRYCGIAPDAISEIPILQEPLSPDPEGARRLVRELGLDGGPYVLYAGRIKESKGLDLMLKAYSEHLSTEHPEFSLVLVGALKTHNHEMRGRLTLPGVRYVGLRPRADVLALMSGAAVCLNVSSIEGMPRVSLEAIALRRPAVLPPNVPEFDRTCPDFVARTRDPRTLAQQIVDIAHANQAPPYPVERHSKEAVMPLYEAVLSPAP